MGIVVKHGKLRTRHVKVSFVHYCLQYQQHNLNIAVNHIIGSCIVRTFASILLLVVC